MDNEIIYYDFQDILKIIGIDRKFEKETKVFPFSRGKENVTFSWGQILIPEYGIREIVQNKISDIDEKPIDKIGMIYIIPYLTDQNSFGIINQDISLSFMYDKEFKYGKIKKSIYEVCFYILEHSKLTNNFYIIHSVYVQDFLSRFVFNNQWGLGGTLISSQPTEKME